MAVVAEISLYSLLLLVAISDFRERRISNQLNLLIAVNAALLHLLDDGSSTVFIAVNLVLTAILFLPGYFTGNVGAGDIKLFCGLSLCWSPTFFLWTLGSGITLLLLFLGMLSLKKRVRRHSCSKVEKTNTKLLSRMPLGTAVFVGAIFTQWLTLLTSY